VNESVYTDSFSGHGIDFPKFMDAGAVVVVLRPARIAGFILRAHGVACEKYRDRRIAGFMGR